MNYILIQFYQIRLGMHYLKAMTKDKLMDLIFVVGAYNMLAMFMNSIGFKTEECVEKSLKES